MLRIVVSFALGAFVTSVAFLWWGGWADGEALTHQSESTETMIRGGGDVVLEPGLDPPGSVALDSHSQGPGAGTATTPPPANDSDTGPDPRGEEGAPLPESAAATRTTQAEMERFGVMSASLDRAFHDEARAHDSTSTSLEGILVNAAWSTWSTVPTASSPTALDTECRASACRLRFEFGMDESLEAAARSDLDVGILDAMEHYGFERVNMLINPEDGRKILDVYLWKEPTP